MKSFLLAQAGEQSKRHLRDFVWSFQSVWFPMGLKERRMERVWREWEWRSCQCFHTHLCRFFSFLSWPPWALTVTLLYHPWIINPFLKSPLWVQGLWVLISYWLMGGKKTQILGNFTALCISYVRRNFIWPQLHKLYQNMPALSSGAWKQPCISEVLSLKSYLLCIQCQHSRLLHAHL